MATPQPWDLIEQQQVYETVNHTVCME